MSAAAISERFSIMSLFNSLKKSGQFLSAASEAEKDDYEKRVREKLQLQRKLKELEAEGKKDSQEYKNTLAELDYL